jgi:type II secretory pathway component GspD/PulD (secretin)
MRRVTKSAVLTTLCAVVAVGTVVMGQRAAAQEHGPAPTSPDTYQTLFVSNVPEPHEISELVNDLRNMLPMAKIYRVESANAISMRASTEDFAIAQKILADIDRPRKTFRLTYTIRDGSELGETQQFAMLVDSGYKTSLKQGTKVPIVTGNSGAGSEKNTQVQYMDIGMNLDATLQGNGEAMRLHTKFEKSSVTQEKSNSGIQDPVINQSILEGESAVVPGKPVIVGSIGLPGGKRLELSVVAEPLK